MKLSEAERVIKARSAKKFGGKSSNFSKENKDKSNLGPMIGSKRKRGDMEASDTSKKGKFVFKYKEGYINAVRRPVPFEFWT